MTSPVLLDIPEGLATELFIGGRGRPVLAVHGTPSVAETMRPFLDVAEGRPRAAVDLPGHGRSPKLGLEGDALLDAIADRILRTLDALGWASCVGFGHSGGCALLYRAALRDPGRFSSMFFAGPVSELPDRRATRAHSASLYPPDNFVDVIDLALEFLFAPQTRARVKPQWREWAKRVDAQSSAALLRAWASGRDVLPAFAALRIPTTVLISTEDRGVPPSESEHVARTLSSRVLRIPGDHFPFDEAPDDAKAALLEFLRTA